MRSVIFFDWDGTLADSMDICISECRQALQRMGLPDQPDETIRRCNGPTYEEACSILQVPEHLHETFIATRREVELTLIPTMQRLFPGVQSMLEALRDKADLVIASNGLMVYLEKSIEALQLDGMFTRVQGHVSGYTKADLLRILMAELRPERAMMVGDRLGDFLAGRENDLPTVAACFGYGNEQEYAQADFRADTPWALQKFLENWLAFDVNL